MSFANRLHTEFLKAGIQSNIISLRSDIPDTDSTEGAGRKAKYFSWLESRIQHSLNRNNLREFGLFTYPVLGTNMASNKIVKNADIIYLHWVLGGFMNLSSIEKIAKLGKPIIFYLHDMWYMTGGCHYSFACEKFKTHCHDCQVFPDHKQKDLSFRGFEKKRKLYSKYNNLYFISPSKWMYNAAKETLLLKDKPVFHIPNILDSTIFKPFDKATAKQILNITSTETVIAFGSVFIDSPFKGWLYLKKALDILLQTESPENITVLIFGNNSNKAIVDILPFKTRYLGYLRDEYSTVLAYNAADVFISPSLADNLPYMIFEALSCGTPVVSFDTGGIPDLINHKQNGYLAKYRDADDLAEGIRYCLQNKIKGFRLPGLETKFTIRKHIELFEQIIPKDNRESGQVSSFS